MSYNNIEIVEKLPNGRMIIKVEKEIIVQNESKKMIKFTIADRNGIVNILDAQGELSGIQFFDCYYLNEFGDVIIGIKKDGEEFYKRVLSHFDLSDTEFKATEVPSGPFNIGPYAKQYYDYEYPTKTIEDIIPQSYAFNYGLINRNGILVMYPIYDQIEFGTENTCIVGVLGGTNLKKGYNDLLSGNSITPICFDIAMNFSEGRAVVAYKNSYGYIDRQKNMIDPENPDEYAENLNPSFVRATDFKDGIATVVINQSNQFNPSIMRAKINKNGDIVEILPPARVLKKRRMNKQGKK